MTPLKAWLEANGYTRPSQRLDAVAALNELSENMRSRGERLINERTIIGELGAEDGEAVLVALETYRDSEGALPVVVRGLSWLDPAKGIDICSPETQELITALGPNGLQVLDTAQEGQLLAMGFDAQTVAQELGLSADLSRIDFLIERLAMIDAEVNSSTIYENEKSRDDKIKAPRELAEEWVPAAIPDDPELRPFMVEWVTGLLVKGRDA